jgi:hypothetical protein
LNLYLSNRFSSAGAEFATNFLPTPPPYVSYLNTDTFGLLMLQTTTTSITGNFLRSSDGAVLDTFTVTLPADRLAKLQQLGKL